MSHIRLKNSGVSVPDEIYVIQNGSFVNNFYNATSGSGSTINTEAGQMYGWIRRGSGRDAIYPPSIILNIKGDYKVSNFSQFYIEMGMAVCINNDYFSYGAGIGVGDITIASFSHGDYEMPNVEAYSGNQTLDISKLKEDTTMFFSYWVGRCNIAGYGIKNLKLIK